MENQIQEQPTKEQPTKKKRPNSIKNNLFFLKKIAKISPERVFHAFLSQFLRYATWTFFTVVFMRYLFGADEITRTFTDVAIFLSLTAAAMLIINIYNAWHDNIFTVRENHRISFALNRELFDKATTVDISCYENPEFYDEYTKALTEATERAESVLQRCSELVSSVIASLLVIYAIFSINIIAGFFAFIPLIGTFFFARIQNKIMFERDMEMVPYQRRISYVNRIMYLPQYAKDMRLTKVFEVIRGTYNDGFHGVSKTYDKYWKRIFLFQNTGTLLNFPIVFEGLWLFAAYLTMVQESILIGDFIVLASAVVSTTWMLFGVRDGILDGYKNSLFIENFKAFINYTPKIDENQPGLSVKSVDTIELRDVSFKYDNSNEYVLRDISMTIKAGDKVAFVGHNGAGKTTLVKLIMRLYDPTDGQILLNNIDIREYDLQTYRKTIGVMFQDFQIFSLSVAENVIMKRLRNEQERKRAVDALKQSNAYEKIQTLKHKEDSVLTREFDDDGVVLSTGEYQKIAIARTFAKNANIFILDEPSSALDPIAEHMMYETMAKLYRSKDKLNNITIFISHRLSSAVSADCIYMLQQGEILECGTHKALMKKSGAYCEMFIKQAQNYLQEVEYE